MVTRWDRIKDFLWRNFAVRREYFILSKNRAKIICVPRRLYLLYSPQKALAMAGEVTTYRVKDKKGNNIWVHGGSFFGPRTKSCRMLEKKLKEFEQELEDQPVIPPPQPRMTIYDYPTAPSNKDPNDAN